MTHILIVEDEPSLSDPLAFLLEREGYDVAWVDTGQRALDDVAATPTELVILDLEQGQFVPGQAWGGKQAIVAPSTSP